MWWARLETVGAWLCAAPPVACAGEGGSGGATVATTAGDATTGSTDPDTATGGSASSGTEDSGTTGSATSCDGPLGLCHALGSVVTLPEDLTAIDHGDLDGDGYEDVVVSGGTPNQVHAAFGAPLNPLQTSVGYAAQFDTGAIDVVLADLDVDGQLDIVLAHPNDLTLLQGAPDGTFAVAGQVGAGSNIDDIGVGSFFEDGSLTIVTADS